jgi:hypothetical protein
MLVGCFYAGESSEMSTTLLFEVGFFFDGIWMLEGLVPFCCAFLPFLSMLMTFLRSFSYFSMISSNPVVNA